MNDSVKYLLPEDRIPRHWYNLVADLPQAPAPVLHSGTQQPLGPADLAPLFVDALIEQEVTTEREVEIPEPVREVYRQWPLAGNLNDITYDEALLQRALAQLPRVAV